jgi:hypothetical protein
VPYSLPAEGPRAGLPRRGLPLGLRRRSESTSRLGRCVVHQPSVPGCSSSLPEPDDREGCPASSTSWFPRRGPVRIELGRRPYRAPGGTAAPPAVRLDRAPPGGLWSVVNRVGRRPQDPALPRLLDRPARPSSWKNGGSCTSGRRRDRPRYTWPSGVGSERSTASVAIPEVGVLAHDCLGDRRATTRRPRRRRPDVSEEDGTVGPTRAARS